MAANLMIYPGGTPAETELTLNNHETSRWKMRKGSEETQPHDSEYHATLTRTATVTNK